MTSDNEPESSAITADKSTRRSLRVSVGTQFKRLVIAIRTGDEATVENAVLSLSRRSRWLAPLAMVVGAFTMLFQGVNLLFTNWRLALVQVALEGSTLGRMSAGL